MKIQCEACGEREACFYCVADEAALCSHCDQRVHSANKLSRLHQRFSLLHPSPSHSKPPLCDICQGKNALFFCEQDRAILCRECDGDIHRPNNERTRKHNRFLLTGVKLSATLSSFSSSSSSAAANLIKSSQNSKPNNKHMSVLPPPPPPPRAIGSLMTTSNGSGGGSGKKEQMMMAIAQEGDDGLMVCGGSPMFEYLEMLPGYHLEELLLDPGYGFSQIGEEEEEEDDDDAFSLWESNFDSLSPLSSESSVMGDWASTFKKRPRTCTD
ncbi:unnamed protein product [Cuscuta campestris]|uniref:B box-type domain-containing protein n=1 Tax=Cuscuta campestris TaxID=132261 RepID=A0A484KAH4_9ASTE|nr:unnamed protein product [Cuscuta campestris]